MLVSVGMKNRTDDCQGEALLLYLCRKKHTFEVLHTHIVCFCVKMFDTRRFLGSIFPSCDPLLLLVTCSDRAHISSQQLASLPVLNRKSDVSSCDRVEQNKRFKPNYDVFLNHNQSIRTAL